MIADLISHVLVETGRQWKIGDKMTQPTETDIVQVLDKAATYLYDEKVGSTFTVGGLLIEKTIDGYEAYVRVGSYK